MLCVCQTLIKKLLTYLLSTSMPYNTIQYKNDFYSAVIEGAEALMGRLWMVRLDYLAPRPPVTVGGSGRLTGKWAEVQRRRTSKTQLSNQRNFLLVCVADSILLLHTPIPVIQGRLRPAKCIIALSVLSWRSLSVIIRAYDALSKHAHSCSGIK